MKLSHSLPIREVTQVGEARRMMSAFAAEIGLPAALHGQLAIVVTELANNLVKHTAAGGTLVYRALEMGTEQAGIEVLSLDQGPGMANVDLCLRDGYSTAGSPGTGLGAIRRLSTIFDIHSIPNIGTAILSRISLKPASLSPSQSRRLEYGVVCLPVQFQQLCGDGWAIERKSYDETIMIADGLGHGPEASKASDVAIEIFLEKVGLGPQAIIEIMHLGLKSTRGAAAAVVRFDHNRSLLRYSGVGNTVGIVFSLATGQQRRMVSHNGTAGVRMSKTQEFDYPWDATSVLVLHTDGLTTHWGLEKYPGLLSRHPGLIAGVLYRDFVRGNDDVTVFVAKEISR